MSANQKSENSIIVKSNEEYPKLKIDRKSLKDARILSTNLAYSTSELSAINQYIYEHFQFDKKYKDISEIMKRISIVEMHHLDIIGEIITELGGRANFQYFYNNRYYPWNANMLYYCDDIKKLMEFNIISEEKAIRQYKYQARIINNGNISEILNRIIKDEEVHIEIFKDILEKL